MWQLVEVMGPTTFVWEGEASDAVHIVVRPSATSDDFDFTGHTWAAAVRLSPLDQGATVDTFTITDNSTATAIDLYLKLVPTNLVPGRQYFFKLKGTHPTTGEVTLFRGVLRTKDRTY